ncbi:MAG: 2-succinyl-5-enolpyruvyl-6-hydroxy-3-cyclohexene-1-carboxylic-acid synthase, partial [Candidatus Eisenbacteria bacterium]
MNAANLHIEWASLLVESLARAGIREAVVSPGSRSTSIVLAAAAEERLHVHSILDERSAAFFALGEAKVSGRPVLLVCTSGTAGAHYLPAVIEAGCSYAPLVVVTADRPPELHGNAAPQTIDQVRLFGSHARAYFELGLPDGSEEALRGLRRKAAQAVLASLHPVPGAVHMNAWFRKPLEPQEANEEDERLRRRIGRVRSEPFPALHPPLIAPDPGGIDDLADFCRQFRRGLIVCGPGPVAQASARRAIEELAETTRFPILAEGASQFRFTGLANPLRCDAFDAFLRSPAFVERHAPQVIVQIGHPPTSKAWERFLRAAPACARAIVAPYGWNDPQNSAGSILIGPVEETAGALRDALMDMGPLRPTKWTEEFGAADGIAWSVVEDETRKNHGFSKGAIARTIVSSIPRGSLLAVGNSLAIREVDNYCPGWMTDALVWSQKGTNGIDGLVSGAAGAASVFGGPVTLYLGDLAFLHDLYGLATTRDLDVPFVVVVAQNDGGRIFEQLPIAGCPDVGPEILSLWTTPHGLDFAHAALLFNVDYRRVDSEGSLREALAEAYARKGATLIEAVVPPSGAAAEH